MSDVIICGYCASEARNMAIMDNIIAFNWSGLILLHTLRASHDERLQECLQILLDWVLA